MILNLLAARGRHWHGSALHKTIMGVRRGLPWWFAHLLLLVWTVPFHSGVLFPELPKAHDLRTIPQLRAVGSPRLEGQRCCRAEQDDNTSASDTNSGVYTVITVI